MKTPIALFGEAERGAFRIPLIVSSVAELHSQFGNPPKESHGISMAVQALLFGHPILYLRVREEGFSLDDYFEGLWMMRKRFFEAVALPGVGSQEVVDAFLVLCDSYHALLFMKEEDFYDYLFAK